MNCEFVYIGRFREVYRCLCGFYKRIDLSLFFLNFDNFLFLEVLLELLSCVCVCVLNW